MANIRKNFYLSSIIFFVASILICNFAKITDARVVVNYPNHHSINQ
jgi:hypothetical protein